MINDKWILRALCDLCGESPPPGCPLAIPLTKKNRLASWRHREPIPPPRLRSSAVNSPPPPRQFAPSLAHSQR